MKLGLKWRWWESLVLMIFYCFSCLFLEPSDLVGKIKLQPLFPLDCVLNCPDVYPGHNIFNNLALCQETYTLSFMQWNFVVSGMGRDEDYKLALVLTSCLNTVI